LIEMSNIDNKNIIRTIVIAGSAVLLMGCNAVSLPGTSSGTSIYGIDINPEDYVELGEYKGLTVPLEVEEVTQDVIDEELEMLASYYAEDEMISEGAVESGDIANIDYVGRKDGVAFDGGTAEGYDLTIGSGSFISGFEDGLIGVKVGETVDLALTFPEEYHSEELAGQDVIFTVTVNSINRQKIPEITDEFIQDITDGNCPDVDTYVEDLKAQIAAEYEESAKLGYKDTVWNAVMDNAKFKEDMPAELVNKLVSKIILNTSKAAQMYGVGYDEMISEYMQMTTDEFNEEAITFATDTAKESMVAWVIAKNEGIEITDEDISNTVKECIEQGQYASEEAFYESNSKEELVEYLLAEKVRDFLVENAKQ